VRLLRRCALLGLLGLFWLGLGHHHFEIREKLLIGLLLGLLGRSLRLTGLRLAGRVHHELLGLLRLGLRLRLRLRLLRLRRLIHRR